MRTCIACNEEKELTEFPPKFAVNKCYVCKRAYYNNWIKNNPGALKKYHEKSKARRNEYSNEYYYKHREEILEKARLKYYAKKQAAEQAE